MSPRSGASSSGGGRDAQTAAQPWDMDALAKVAAMPREEIHARAQAIYLADAKQLAEQTRRDPYRIGGRGSTLEQDLAARILALCEEYGHG